MERPEVEKDSTYQSPVDKMETALSNKLVQAAAARSTTTSQQFSESLLLDNETMTVQPSKLGLEESVAPLKQQEPLPVDKMETALNNKLVQAAAARSTTTSQQFSESLLLDNEAMTLQFSKLRLEESVESLKRQEPLPVDKVETTLSNKLVQAAAAGSTATSQKISESLLLSVASLKQQEPLPVDKTETALSNKLVQAVAAGSTATSQKISESLLLSVASLKQQEPPPQPQHPPTASIKRRAIVESSSPIIPLKRPNQDTHRPLSVDKMETALSNKLAQAAAGGSTTTSQQISQSLLLLSVASLKQQEPPPQLQHPPTASIKRRAIVESSSPIIPLKRPNQDTHRPLSVDKMETALSNKLVQATAGGSTTTSQQISQSLLLSVASLKKQQEPPPQLQHPPTASIKRRAIVESSSPIIPLKRPNQDTHRSPVKITGISSSDTAVTPSKQQLLSTKPVKESLEKSSSLQPLHCHSLTETELESPLKFNLPMGVPTKPRTPKLAKKFEREAAQKIQGKLPISSSSKKPVAEMMATPLQQPEVNLETKEKSAQMLDMVFHPTEMEENAKTMLLSFSSLARRFDGNKDMMTAAMHMMSGSAPKEEGNDVVVKSVEEMHVKMPVLEKDENQPVSRKGKEKVVAENSEEMHLKMPVLEKDENQPVSRKGKEKVVAENIEEMHVKMPVLEKDENQPLSRKGKEKVVANDDQPFIIDGDVDQLKEKPYNLRKRKPNQMPRSTKPTDFENAVTKVTAEVKEKPKGLKNKQKKKEEAPKFAARYVYPLTEKEIAEDLFAITTTRRSRQKRRRPQELQKEIDKLCPTRVEFIISPDDY